MQLTAPGRAALVAAMLSLSWAVPASAQVDVGLDTTHTAYREQGGPLEMTVYTPSADLSIEGKHVGVEAQYEADIVSGASVAVVDAPSSDVDAITSATRLDDKRHTVGGNVLLKGEYTTLTAGFTHGRESDYRSNAFSLSASAELFERNTRLELSYGRGFDEVCTLSQPRAQEAVDRRRMPTAQGCFGGDDRVSEDLDLQTFQGSWTQAWTPILATQLTVTGQLLNGFQANPYRGVWLGRAAALENHPENRARYAGGLGIRLWIEPLSGALQAFARLYRDTWDVESATAELAYEQSVKAGIRIRVRGRYYLQDRAFFYSDDYVRFPRGQYFTGDRELSTMSSWAIGGALKWTVPPGEDGNVLGFMGSLNLVLKADYVQYSFDNFHYGQASVPNDNAIIATLGIETVF